MQNISNIFSIIDFREKYGFTQTEMAAMLGVNRGQLSHTEISARPLPVEAEQKFIELTEVMQPQDGAEGDLDFAREEQEKRNLFIWRSENNLIEMKHKVVLLQKELPRLEKREKQLLSAIKNWNELSESAKSRLPLGYLASTFHRRLVAKLAKCDIGVQLDKQAQIKILLAGVEALTQFIADYKNNLTLNNVV